jgi:ABC-type glutathione transport system ATPase component
VSDAQGQPPERLSDAPPDTSVAWSVPPALLDVRDLSVSFATSTGTVQAVDGVSFAVERGEVLALVGESGSGKSVCAMTLMGLTRAPNATIAGVALLDGEELVGASEAKLRRIRGAQLAMVFQDPQSSLNPVHRVGEQIAEQIRAHEPLVSKTAALERAAELMERVEIPRARERVRAYPHELSGGMRQRVMIAMALSLGAKALLADEPTTALDVTVQAQILSQLKRLRDEEDIGIVLVTHDFGVVADIADRIAVMQAGRIVELGGASKVLSEPKHPYTRGLLEALQPTLPRRPAQAHKAPLLQVSNLLVRYAIHGARATPIEAVAGVSLTVGAAETVAIVGESGCGKTTLLRSIARLVRPSGGKIVLAGQDIAHASRRELARLRREMGIVFQDSHASLNPRRRVAETLEQALRVPGIEAPTSAEAGHAQVGVRWDVRAESARLLERVGLTAEQGKRFPHELSGGQRQRVNIARALAGGPRLVLLDEPVSSLDASLRRGILELLRELQQELGCGYVLVSHDLATVEAVADRVAVMQGGKIVEQGDAKDVFERPQHSYTQTLLAASPKAPSLPGGVRSSGWAPPTQQSSFSA